MSRFTRQELLDHVTTQTLAAVQATLATALPSGQGLDMAAMRTGIAAAFSTALTGIAEAFRHLYDVTNAEAVMYQVNGDSPDGQYVMNLLEEGEAGGLAIPDGAGGFIETGYQLLPIVTGAPVDEGVQSPSDPFDGEPEIAIGSIPNTMRIQHDGQITISASCLPEVNAGQNKQIEVDIAVFNDAGVAIAVLGFRSSVNNTNNGRANSAIVPSFTIQNEALIAAGSNIGLVIRKNVAEGVVDVTLKRSFVLLNYNSLARTPQVTA